MIYPRLLDYKIVVKDVSKSCTRHHRNKVLYFKI